MTKDELQNAFKIRIDAEPTTGRSRCLSMPQDIIDNTRRAFNTDPTSPPATAALGVPTGRYIAPASDAGCIALYPRRLRRARQQIVLNGPLFVALRPARRRSSSRSSGRLDGGVQLRDAECVRQHQLQPGLQPGYGRDDLPGDERVPRHRRGRERSRRTARADGLARQLVGTRQLSKSQLANSKRER